MSSQKTEKMLSKAAKQILIDMLDAETRDDLEDAEIVCEGRECWLGLRRVSKACVNELLRLCLLHDDSEQGKGVERYTLNSEGRAIVLDEKYTPLIVRALNGEQF